MVVGAGLRALSRVRACSTAAAIATLLRASVGSAASRRAVDGKCPRRCSLPPSVAQEKPQQRARTCIGDAPSTRIRFQTKRMGRRSRNRSRREMAKNTASRVERRDRMARVHVSDDVWADFRAAAGHRPISEVLGELVSREVDRYRSRRLRDGQLAADELVYALEDARRQRGDLELIVERLERLHRPR